jgi:hypothetical protein
MRQGERAGEGQPKPQDQKPKAPLLDELSEELAKPIEEQEITPRKERSPGAPRHAYAASSILE